MLLDSGWTDESGDPPLPLEDLHERQNSAWRAHEGEQPYRLLQTRQVTSLRTTFLHYARS